MEPHPDPAPARSEPETPGGIFAAMRQWRAAANSAGKVGPTLHRRVAVELRPYLGSSAAGAVLDDVSDSSANLLSTIEPVLAGFLGARAASLLVSRIVDTLIVNN